MPTCRFLHALMSATPAAFCAPPATWSWLLSSGRSCHAAYPWRSLGISLVNAPGLIDSNYRGEIKAVLVNLDPKQTFQVKRGDRIAQLVIVRMERAVFEPCKELPASERGEGGFGSSGVSS